MFLTFLVCSGLIWFINNLSESYISNAKFKLEFVNIPDSLLLTHISKNEVDVKIQATGFQFLGFNIKNQTVQINVASSTKERDRYFIAQNVYRKQIDDQLRSMTLLDIDRDTLFFEFTEIGSKTVPVISKINITLSQNYFLDGALKIEPDTITVKGPKSSIDSINMVNTVKIDFPEETLNFAHKVELYKSPELENTSYSENTVFIYGKVARFSEKIIEAPIEVINLPEGLEIRTFPEKASILCRAKIDDLKHMDGSVFRVVADYNDIKDDASKVLSLKLLKKPENLHNAQLNEDQVEYILKRP
jgi:hypothetical protein